MNEVDAANARREPLLGYATGSSDPEDLSRGLQQAWDEILGDPVALSQAADILRVPQADLAAYQHKPPVGVQTGESGTGGVETAVIVFVTAVGYDVLKDVVKDVAKAALTELWRRVIKPRVERHLPLGAFGDEKPVSGDADGSPKSP